MIPKFIIKDGYSNICFDLDSYKLNENKYITNYFKKYFKIIYLFFKCIISFH